MAIRYPKMIKPAGNAKDIFTTSFAPKGRRHAVIYAVCVADHEGVVKVGRTVNWKSRRNSYQRWNLNNSSAITSERIFIITDEFADLAKIDGAILEGCHFPLRHGREWFVADLDDICRYVDRFLTINEISFVVE